MSGSGRWFEPNRLHKFYVDTASDERFSGTAVWVMRSPEVSPSSLDVVIAPVICWQKRGAEKIWRLGKTSAPSWRCGRVVIASATPGRNSRV